jgi:hypothetical protein
LYSIINCCSSISSVSRTVWISVSSRSNISNLLNPAFLNLKFIFLCSGISGNVLIYLILLMLWKMRRVISLYTDTLSDSWLRRVDGLMVSAGLLLMREVPL